MVSQSDPSVNMHSHLCDMSALNATDRVFYLYFLQKQLLTNLKETENLDEDAALQTLNGRQVWPGASIAYHPFAVGIGAAIKPVTNLSSTPLDVILNPATDWCSGPLTRDDFGFGDEPVSVEEAYESHIFNLHTAQNYAQRWHNPLRKESKSLNIG